MPAIIQRKEATANLLSFYHTGKPCKRGHIADRVTKNSDYVLCLKERAAAQHRRRTPEETRRRNELAAQRRREAMPASDRTVRRTLMGLGHVMDSASAQERSKYLDGLIRRATGLDT